MNSSLRPSLALRRLTAARASLVLLFLPVSFSLAQLAPGSAATAADLAKYDRNKNGVLDPAELAAKQADEARARAAVAAASPGDAKPTEEVVSLSPFEVVSDTKGYYGANTMSGTRFNSKLEDLASSVTVMTKEQMQDFGMLDINDIFLYTASTEGTGTFTDLTVDRNGSVSDNVQLDPANANRVRGIAAANISLGNIETMGRVPIDPIAVDAIELSRGPNANVFGLGNPSGTVNQVAAAANLTRDRTSAQFRADSYDGYRTSLDLNRVVKKGVLAVRASAVYQHDGFVRKPSGVDTERYNGMVKYQPFKNTTISGSYSYFHQYGTRPNFSNPRDSLSYWVQSGKPTWDPIAQVVHVNGTTIGAGGVGTTTPIVNATGLPDYFNMTFTGQNHSYLFIDQGGIGLFAAPTTFGSLATGPISGAQGVRFVSASPAAGTNLGKFLNQPLFTTTPSIKDKSIYDWTAINLASVNRDWDRAITSNVQLDQVFLSTQRHTLVGQVSAMREDSLRYRRDYVGIANDNGQSGQLLIDVNEKLLDGTANPYFLRPYIGQDQPRTTYQPAKWDTYRAQLGYKLDLTHEGGLLKWLGSHQLSAYDEYKYRINRRYSYREAILDAQPWIAAGLSRGNQSAITGGPAAALAITRSYLRYYVGDNQGANIDYAPGDFKAGSYPFVYGNYTLAGGVPVAGSGTFVRNPAQVGLAAVTDSTGAGINSKTILKTLGGVIQSHFLDDHLVTTFGIREDKQYQKAGSAPQLLNADGTTFNFDSIDHWTLGDYKFNSGKTKQQGYVVRPFRGASFIGQIDQQGAPGHFLASALNGLSLTYNRSDSFKPQDPKINLFFKPLPNPSGTGKDYGFGLNLFDGRVVVRFNHYENQQLNKSGGDAGTIAQRVTRTDVTSTGVFLLAARATDWVTAVNPAFTAAQVQAEVAKQIGLSVEVQNALIAGFNAGTISSTQDVTAKGNELEINFNPTKNWTIAASGTDTRSFNSNVSTDIQQWIDQRMPIWTTIKDQRTGALWWTTSYSGGVTAAANYATFVDTPFNVVRQQEGKSNPQIRRYAAKASTNYRLAGISDNRWLKSTSIGGALRWESPGAIGYYGAQKLPAVITSLDANNPIYDKAHLYADLNLSYSTRLFANKIGTRFQLNVRNVQESGRLQPVAAYPDGTPNAYRIVDPRQFIFTVTFDL